MRVVLRRTWYTSFPKSKEERTLNRDSSRQLFSCKIFLLLLFLMTRVLLFFFFSFSSLFVSLRLSHPHVLFPASCSVVLVTSRCIIHSYCYSSHSSPASLFLSVSGKRRSESSFRLFFLRVMFHLDQRDWMLLSFSSSSRRKPIIFDCLRSFFLFLFLDFH